MSIGSERAKRAWITRRANAAKKPVLPANWTKLNPFNSTTDRTAYQRWYASMRKYGRVLSKEDIHELRCQAARKAAITRFGQPVKQAKKDYNAKEKNHFRKFVVRSFKKTGTTCLSLESPKFLFARALPNMQHTVFENNLEQYNAMRDLKPQNVEHLKFANVMYAPEMIPDKRFDCAFLDYCKTFHTEVDGLYALKPFLAGCKKLAFTFAVRDHTWKWKAGSNGDFKMELVAKLLTIFKDYEFEYGASYKDTATMIGVILAKPGYRGRRGLGEPAKKIQVLVPLRILNELETRAKENHMPLSEEIRKKLER